MFFAGIAICAIIGPFGTYERLGLSERVVYWVIVLSGVGFFMHIIMIAALTWPRLASVRPIFRLGLGAGLAGLPGAAIVIFVQGVFLPPPLAADRLPVIWAQVAVIGWIIGSFEFLERRGEDRAPPAVPRTVFHKRLPPDAGDDIISISMQDHYAEVTTTQGKHLVLIRLADAMDELRDADGVQLHRSHFAMVAHLRELQRHDGKYRIVLSDGRILPISATHVDEVRAALNRSCGT